jgi:hypothetical protein
MGRAGVLNSAPTELSGMPNQLPAVDAAIASLFHIAHVWRGTTEAERWTALHP